MVVVVVVIGAVLFIKLEMFEVKTYIFIHFRNKLQCGFNNKQMEEGEATVQERSSEGESINEAESSEIGKNISMWFVFHYGNIGRSVMYFFNSPTLSLIRMCILL